ncbi:hypothetical protein [Zooshikella ganghwensis]|uniref:PEP-CTERM sorting domain-containing protein n=1 Tax=Zooshikella ganghwensis TaxID=202772 RepID=A0A4P9VUC1_9GAMM|nr:hypothetical protein [Zooshikella ganghwensis]RDH46327.1 hypothetical protein B9G39_24345 [Zooshikella ganghwensis]
MFKQMVYSVSTSLALSLGNAYAFTIPITDAGWYDDTGTHTFFNNNYLVGDAQGTEYHNWFLFILSNYPTFTSATLRAYLNDSPPAPEDGYLSTDASETWSLWSVETDLSTLYGGGGGLAAFIDLGSGTAYGSVNVTASDVGSFVEVDLNASALAAMNAANDAEKFWVIGGSITTLGDGDDAIFWFSQHRDDGLLFSPRVELVVNESRPEPDPIPEPPLLVLFGLGVLGISCSCKKVKGKT